MSPKSIPPTKQDTLHCMIHPLNADLLQWACGDNNNLHSSQLLSRHCLVFFFFFFRCRASVGGAILLYPGCRPAAGADEGLEGRRLWQRRRGVGRGGGAHPAGSGGRESAPAKAAVHGFVRWPRPRHARYEHGTRIVCTDCCKEYTTLCGSPVQLDAHIWNKC